MLTITTIGAFPKPSYVPVSDWFTRPGDEFTEAYLAELAAAGDGAEAQFTRATHEVVRDQVEAGIDLPTDGEIRREARGGRAVAVGSRLHDRPGGK